MERRLFPWLYKWQNHRAALGSWEGSLTSCNSVGGLLSAVLIMLLKAALTPLKAASDSVFPCVLLRQTQLKGRSGHAHAELFQDHFLLSVPSLPPSHLLAAGAGALASWLAWPHTNEREGNMEKTAQSQVVTQDARTKWSCTLSPSLGSPTGESSTSQSGTIRAASVSTALDPVILKDPLLVSNDHLSC